MIITLIITNIIRFVAILHIQISAHQRDLRDKRNLWAIAPVNRFPGQASGYMTPLVTTASFWLFQKVYFSAIRGFVNPGKQMRFLCTQAPDYKIFAVPGWCFWPVPIRHSQSSPGRCARNALWQCREQQFLAISSR